MRLEGRSDRREKEGRHVDVLLGLQNQISKPHISHSARMQVATERV